MFAVSVVHLPFFTLVTVNLHRSSLLSFDGTNYQQVNNKEIPMIHQVDCETLRQSGWAENAIERLRQLRQEYMVREHSQTLTDQRRLEFVRWLVLTGKLSELSA